MLLTVEKVWSKVQDFIKRIGDLEDDTKGTKKEVDHLRRELHILNKDVDHNEKIQDHHGQKLAELEARIKKIESEKHGAKVSAGRAKAANARLKKQVKGITGGKSKGKKDPDQKDLLM